MMESKDYEQLKIEINNFVWMHAPGQMTLEYAEQMAMEIYIMFVKAQEKFAKYPRQVE